MTFGADQTHSFSGLELDATEPRLGAYVPRTPAARPVPVRAAGAPKSERKASWWKGVHR